jgi:hypothetical protein
MNSVMERWMQTCRREVLDRTLIWNQRLLHTLREFESFYNEHRPHRTLRPDITSRRWYLRHAVPSCRRRLARRATADETFITAYPRMM